MILGGKEFGIIGGGRPTGGGPVVSVQHCNNKIPLFLLGCGDDVGVMVKGWNSNARDLGSVRINTRISSVSTQLALGTLFIHRSWMTVQPASTMDGT